MRDHWVCPRCGWSHHLASSDAGSAIANHETKCARKEREEKQRKESVTESQYEARKLADGTYLVCLTGHNINRDHWHIAADGTILAIKGDKHYLYKRDHIRRRINEVTGLSLPEKWS
jgi:hypothetical protein